MPMYFRGLVITAGYTYHAVLLLLCAGLCSYRGCHRLESRRFLEMFAR